MEPYHDSFLARYLIQRALRVSHAASYYHTILGVVVFFGVRMLLVVLPKGPLCRWMNLSFLSPFCLLVVLLVVMINKGLQVH